MTDNGEGPIDPETARQNTAKWIDREDRKIKKGTARDARTRDDRLDDPSKQEPDPS